MKIKYLKEAPQAKAGDIRELENAVANVLILTGYAEAYTEEKPKPKAKAKTTKKDNE